MIDQNLKAYISGLGTAAGDRVHLGNAFQDTQMPVVVIRRVSGSTPRTLSGQALFSRAQYTISVVGRDYASVMPVVNQLRAALDGFRGLIGVGTPVPQTNVLSARSSQDPVDLSDLDGDVTLRVMSLEFFFVYQEA